jgi:hypothetical protein
MAIDFPPPPTPMQSDEATLQADSHQGSVVVDVVGYTLYVHAPGILDESDVSAATAGLEDLSAAVRALATAAQRKGVLAPKTLYARSGNSVYVSIYAGTIDKVTAPEPLMPYFEGLVTGEPPTINAFERKRLLGSLHANRMGAGFTPVFLPTEAGAYDLTFKPGAEAVNPGAVRVNLSNTGNRFTGREFLDLDARRGTADGDEFSALARTAASVLELDEVVPGSDYHEYQLGWSRVNPWGLVGLTGRYLDYRQRVQGVSYNGELWTLDLGYTGVLQSTTSNRVTLQGKVDYTAKELATDEGGQRIQKEPYTSLEAGIAWSRSFRFLGEGWLSQVGLSGRKGLGGVGPTLTVADLQYWLVRPSFSLRSQGSAVTGELQASLQYADVTVPEQQQWIVGGIGSMHAYVPGVAVGDRGALVRLVGEYEEQTYGSVSVKPRVFAEFAAVEYANDFGGLLPSGVRTLSDAGAEVVVGLGPYFETALTAALPLQSSGVDKQVRDDARADFFFRLTAKF